MTDNIYVSFLIGGIIFITIAFFYMKWLFDSDNSSSNLSKIELENKKSILQSFNKDQSTEIVLRKDAFLGVDCDLLSFDSGLDDISEEARIEILSRLNS